MQHAMYAVEALSGFVGGAVKGFFKGPPAIYDPTVHTMRGWQKKFQEVWLKEGFGAAYNNLRMMTVMRTGGVLVGQDHLGNRYFENKDAPYGRTRWCEMPTPSGVWAIEDKYDGSMIPPEWHGWMTYMHDIPGSTVNAKYAQPFRTPWRENQTFLRKEFYPDEPAGFHKPPGQWGVRTPEQPARGRIGPKYAAWDPNGSNEPAELRNYADNSKRLEIP
eukprot:Transcript_30491.p2 GENE.Transcript_30491~~Transcript_30491.p2  ORF type:complete len:218 (-),score=76.94 Transcript_30491:219-872(-)